MNTFTNQTTITYLEDFIQRNSEIFLEIRKLKKG